MQIVRGVCTEPVCPKDKVKSLNSCKSFEATRSAAVIGRWLGLLAEELAMRMAEDEADNRRRARSLGECLSVAGGGLCRNARSCRA